MDTLTCRLLPFASADGPHNMAADETLLRTAQDGSTSLRFYTWTTATTSLGYFQPAAVLQTDAKVAPLPWLRRPSGGLTLVHDQEVTYALALPMAPGWGDPSSWVVRMHQIIAGALRSLGVPCSRLRQKADPTCPPSGEGGYGPAFFCFHHVTCGDLLLANAKIVGSAQRKQRGALLQHGAILLAQSRHTPTLPGIAEFTGKKLAVEEVIAALEREFAVETSWRLTADEWTLAERQHTETLVRERYTQTQWNNKR